MSSVHTAAECPEPSPLSSPVNEDAVLGASQTSTEVENAAAKDLEYTLSETTGTNHEHEARRRKSFKPYGEWTQYKERMRRLDAAVKCAIAVSKSETNSVSPTKSAQTDAKAVTISFKDNQTYMIPWRACRTWRCMEAFLRKWFSDDELAVKNIIDGNFTLGSRYSGSIHPELWESVVSPGMSIEFSQQLPLAAPEIPMFQAPAPPVITNAKETLETRYENRIQYKVSYYQRRDYPGQSDFISENIYTEPIELEITHEHDMLPALEERKKVESPPDPSKPFDDFGMPPKASTRLPKLRQADIVSEPTLKIHSPYLLNILKSVIEYSSEMPGAHDEGLDAGVFAYPYKDLYHHLDDLLRYREGESDLRKRHPTAFNQYADEHIDLLQSYLESQPTVQYKEAKARWSRDTPVTTFATFWLLMKPGTDVYVREADGSYNRYVLDKLMGGISQGLHGRNEARNYTVQVWNLALNDRTIKRYSRQIHVQIFDDERKITELPVFPVRYHDEQDDGFVHQALIDRGRKYSEYSKGPCFLQYNGVGLKPGSRSYKRARVVVEHASRPWDDKSIWGADLDHHIPTTEDSVGGGAANYPPYPTPFSMAPPPPPPLVIGASIRMARCECMGCKANAAPQSLRLKFSEYREIDPRGSMALDDHQCSILPSHMFAFILNDRAYDLLDVARLQEPSMAETAIDRLVMQPDNKNLIKAVAKTYTDNSELFSADFIYGKGEGQIILLHGPPGTGKTLTAESVAEFTRRPLLNITAADLGHEPDALEKSLLQYFRRANDWDAIVLLDEADVYLEKRSTSDLKRNSIVSVFLRALDYFQGILFLTTNRVGQFDEAFMSRIHLSLGYDKLNDNARSEIWDNMFQKLKDDHKSGGPKIEYDYDAKNYVTKNEEVKALNWNGREIRNAFQTAVALAVYDSKHKHNGAVPEVMEKHLKQVVSMSSAFRLYIKSSHQGLDDSELAYRQGNRDDRVQHSSAR